MLVHNAARALILPTTIEAALETAAREGAALVAVPVRDTLEFRPMACVPRTPSIVRRCGPRRRRRCSARELGEMLARALAEEFSPTDDAALYERYVGPVPLVRGDESNLKLTTPADLEIAEAILARRAREGQR